MGKTLMAKPKRTSKTIIEDAMSEVHTNVPSTVKATGKTGAATEKMLTAIALSKARAACDHCFHRLHTTQMCCWCGQPRALQHGPYAPEGER
jgi:hypothetical protein